MELEKGYKQTEVGVIPEDWDLSPLGQISDVIMGQSPLGSTYNKTGKGIALINGPTEFTDIHPIKAQWTTNPTKLCKKGDLLICVRGSSTGRMNISDDEYCIGRGLAAIRAKSSSNTVYLTNQIHLGIEKLLSLSAGSTFPNVDGKAIRSIKIPIPPTLEEQSAIATVLYETDALVQSLEKLIYKKRAIKQGAIQELLIGKRRLQGFSGAKYIQTSLGMMPEDWDIYTIGEFLHFKNGLNKAKNFFGQGSPIVNYMDVYGKPGLLFSDIAGKVNVSTDEQRNYEVKKGDVLFTRTSETVDEIGISSVMLDEIDNAVFSGFVLRGRPKNNMLDLHFKKYCFRSEIVRRQIISTASYTTRALTNGRLLSKVLLPLPPTLEEQQAIACVLSDMDSEIEVLELKLIKYKQIKQGMMQNLLTGRIRLV